MHWYTDVLMKKYATFSGRARRKEFWMFTLVSFIVWMVIGVIDAVIGWNVRWLGVIYGFAILVPTLAVNVRRLHDIGRSGWWTLIFFLPLIGAIILFMLLFIGGGGGSVYLMFFLPLLGVIMLIGGFTLLVCAMLDSEPEDNAYGPNPKAAAT
jgi:uncharacterized membrane protein YhaH (DUF805 family)